jgi:hypothetical protein
MSKTQQMPDAGTQLRLYSPPWTGETVFACRKCQRKIKEGNGSKALAKIKKWFRKRSAKSPERPAVSVIVVPCLDVCPKDGITIFSARQLARKPARLNIVRSEADLERFYCDVTDVALFPENDTAK